MSRKKQKHRKGEPQVNEHHLLFTRHEWIKWGSKLRGHPYYKRIIPIKKLHDQIRRQIECIPSPPKEICKYIFNATEDALMRHEIDADYDTIEQRIDFFLKQLNGCRGDNDCLATISALEKQREIVSKYYAKSSTLSQDHYHRKAPVYRDRMEKFHILFPDKKWGVKGYGQILSSHSYFVVTISQNLAKAIYREVREIKKPKNGYSLKNVNWKFERDRKTKLLNPKKDSLEERIGYLIESFMEEDEFETARSLECVLEAIKIFHKKRS